MTDTLRTQRDILAACPPNVGMLFRNRVTASRDRVAFSYPDGLPEGPNAWTPMTWGQTRDQVDVLAAGLLELGLGYEQRVAISMRTRIEWVLADLAVTCAAGAVTTIYPNTNSDDVHYILTDSDSTILIAENWAQVAKTLDYPDLTDRLKHIILVDDDRAAADRVDQRVLTWSELIELGTRALTEKPECVTEAIGLTHPDSLATLTYTSGTTGRPKGVELTHQCWTYEGMAMVAMNIVFEDDLQYLWLPFAHVFGKVLLSCQLAIGFASAVDGRIDRIVKGMGEVRPTFMCGAPRIFEKVRSAVLTSSTQGTLKSRIARRAFSIGRASRPYRLAGKPMPLPLAVQYKIADALVFSKLKKLMGGRVRFFISGSAKLNAQVQAWFYSAGLTVVEGYGMTELSAIGAVNHPNTPRFGTVGTVTPGVECRIAEDGEVLYRGPIVTRGYRGLPEVTAEAFDADGWFHTGDLGELDDEGYLTVTDRKKDLIKTSGGKFVAPQKVEGAIVANIPYVSQAVALGEGHKYVSALVTLDRDALLKWGRRHGHPDADYAELSQRPEIHASIEKQMAKANAKLERWETVKSFAILDHEFGIDDGSTTANMKVRRDRVVEMYADIIEGLYPDEDRGEE